MYNNSMFDEQLCSLLAYNYQEGPCQHVIAALEKCCEKYGSRSKVCAGIHTSKKQSNEKR